MIPRDDSAGNVVKVRRATPWDVVKLARMMVQAAKDQGKHIWFPQAEPTGAGPIFYMLNLIDKGLVLLAESEKDGRVVGAVGAAIYREPWSPDWMIAAEWTYVLPSYRKQGIGSSLLTAMERFADDKGLPVIIGNLTGVEVGSKDKMIASRDGYQYGGGNFVRAPRHGKEEK